MIVDIFGLIAFGAFTLIFFGILVYAIKVRVNLKKVTNLVHQQLADKAMMAIRITELSEQVDKEKLQNTDGFIRFISESRDWAFDYIEGVQAELIEFDKVMGPILHWNSSYGTVLGDTPHSLKIEEISLAYEKIKNLLPKDETPNN